MSQSSLLLPSPAQIALALVTVRSKPANITIEEHLRDVRQSVVPGAAQPDRWSPKHIDASHFWKDAFLRSQGDEWALQDELSALRQQFEKIGGPTKTAATRKAENSVVNTANTHSKRKKTEPDAPDQDALYHPAHSKRHIHPATQRVLRAILRLLMPGSSNDVTRSTITTGIQLLCRALQDCLHSASVSGPKVQEDLVPLTLAEVCPSIVSSHTLILSVLSAAHPGFDVVRTTSGIIAVFQTLLDTLHKRTLDEARRRTEQDWSSKERKAKSNTKAMKDPPEHRAASFTLSATLLVRTAQHMVAAFDLDVSHHCQVFKSVLSVLIDDVASVLSLFVFVDPQDTAMDGRLVEQPRQWRQNSGADMDTIVAAAEIKAPYVLAVLKFTLCFLREREHALPVLSREIIGGSLTDIDNDMLTRNIEKRLQNTLMRGIFGPSDGKFTEAFTTPSTPESNDIGEVQEDAGAELNGSEWFIGQVWELLGWDILSGKMSCMKQS